jgi:hypothetical protein
MFYLLLLSPLQHKKYVWNGNQSGIPSLTSYVGSIPNEAYFEKHKKHEKILKLKGKFQRWRQDTGSQPLFKHAENLGPMYGFAKVS